MFYIKPQPTASDLSQWHHCLISFFHIKPQLRGGMGRGFSIVLYHFSTSNHNCVGSNLAVGGLSYIFFLHQTTTSKDVTVKLNILSYIFFLHQTTTLWEQALLLLLLSYIFFLHQTTTLTNAGHNKGALSYIFFLHQTTTHYWTLYNRLKLSYIFFLHQTTTDVH